MATVTILRRLWRFRLLVALVALLAVALGVLVSYKVPSMESRKYEVGVATVRILVDTPASQVVDVAPKGSDSLGVRATLIANLMVDGVVKSAIAKRAGIPETKLLGVADSAEGAPPDAAKPDPRGYQLATKVLMTAKGDSLPIIEVSTQGPDARAAERIANAAVEGLRDYVSSKAAADQIPDGERLRVSGLSLPQARQEVRGPRLLFSLAAALAVFGFGCATILMLAGLISAFREEQEPTKLASAGELEPDDESWELEEHEPDAWAVAEREAAANVRPIAPKQSSEATPPVGPVTSGPAKRATSWWGDGPAA